MCIRDRDFYLWPEYSPHGYVWMIPKKGGRANVGLVTTDKRGAIKYLDKFVEDTYLKGKEIQNPEWRKEGIKPKPFGGTIPISGPREITTGDGLILVGDAAGFTSPLFEGGSHLALWSGREAALTISAAISADDLSNAKMQPYVKAWKKRFPPYHKILKVKLRFTTFPTKNYPIWRIACQRNWVQCRLWIRFGSD